MKSSVALGQGEEGAKVCMPLITFKGNTSLLMEKNTAIAFVHEQSPATFPHTLLAVSML